MLKNKLKLWSEFKSIFARNDNNSKEIKQGRIVSYTKLHNVKYNFAAGWKSACKRHRSKRTKKCRI